MCWELGVKGNIFEGPDRRLRIAKFELRNLLQVAEESRKRTSEDIAQGQVALALADAVAFAQTFDADGKVSHNEAGSWEPEARSREPRARNELRAKGMELRVKS